jgi:hypothetical protein
MLVLSNLDSYQDRTIIIDFYLVNTTEKYRKKYNLVKTFYGHQR